MSAKWLVKHLQGEKITVFETSGLYSPEDSSKLMGEILSVDRDAEQTGILIDHRAAEVKFGTLDIYNCPKLYAGQSRLMKLRVAFLFRAIGPDEQFYETVCRNSGYAIRVFDDYDKSLAWLLKAEGPEGGKPGPA